MKKTVFLLLTLILSAIALVSCNEESAPTGLQVVAISEEEGFKFYGPDGWTVVNDYFNADYKVYATKLTGRSKTSITFVEAPMPEGGLDEYFAASIAEFPESFKVTVTKNVTKATFGNASDAYNSIYTYKYTEYDYSVSKYVEKDMTCMQYFIKHGGRFYIFTYTAYGTPDDESADYQTYLSLVNDCVKNFLFTDRVGSSESPVYEKDADGYNLVSDKTLCGYELYLPDSYQVVGTNGDVEAKIAGGAALSITRASDAGVNIVTYMSMRRHELSGIVSDIKDIEVSVTTEYDKNSDIFSEENWEITVMPTVDKTIKFGNLTNIASYEYTYVYNGVTYHVYQMLGVDMFAGYVFTYTATEEEYSQHLDEIKIILEKVKF